MSLKVTAMALNVVVGTLWTVMLVSVVDGSPTMYGLAGFFLLTNVLSLAALRRTK